MTGERIHKNLKKYLHTIEHRKQEQALYRKFCHSRNSPSIRRLENVHVPTTYFQKLFKDFIF